MALHKTSGRWRLGLALALVTAGFWSTLPVALKVTLQQIDAYTLTWARFLFAFALVGVWLALRKSAINPPRSGRMYVLLMLAALTLIGNYVFYLLGLHYTTPGNAQLLIQLAPVLMTMGGIFIFRERFNLWQWLGFVVVIIGLVLFFGDQFAVQENAGNRYVYGSLLVILAAVVWAVYAMAQKQLLNHLSSQQIMWVIYAVGSVLLLPMAHPSSLLKLDALHAAALLYCAVNTVGAYGAFAEALAHWEASRVSVILALTPLLCVGTVAIAHAWAPDLIRSEQIEWLGWAGAVLVVSGSALAALMKSRTPQ